MTSLLTVLKKRYPQARIGVLVGSWALPVIQNHPSIAQIHTVDHWKLNRARFSFIKKCLIYYKTKRKAIAAIRTANYEIAIDAYYHFPNAIPIFWKAEIPIRIGYTSAGFGPLLTHAVDWSNRDQSVVKYYLPLLNVLGMSQEDYLPFLVPNLPRTKISGKETLFKRLPCDLSKGYVVIHIGTGSTLKEWPLDKWRELAKKLQGYTLIFTGKGHEEKTKIDTVIHQLDNCWNLADTLNWEEFIAVLQDSELLVSVDSLPGHLAAAFEIPTVLIFNGMTNPHHWAPVNKRCTIITHHVPCAPCYRSQGCSSMTCIRNVGVEEVYRACLKGFNLNPCSPKSESNFFGISDQQSIYVVIDTFS